LNLNNEEERKTEKKRKKKKPRSSPGLLGFVAQPAPTAPQRARSSRPARLARGPRSQPVRRSRPRARLPRLLTLPPGPRTSATPNNSVVFLAHVESFSPTKPRQRWQEQARGSRPGHGPVSPCAAPTQPHASRLMRCTRLHHSIAVRHGSLELRL